jgi:hypothetical protein
MFSLAPVLVGVGQFEHTLFLGQQDVVRPVDYSMDHACIDADTRVWWPSIVTYRYIIIYCNLVGRQVMDNCAIQRRNEVGST